MNSFLELHGLSISGVINTFDRVIFKGHLNGFFPDGAFGRYLSRRGILLKDAGPFFEAETQRIRDHVVSLAAAAGRPVDYLAGASTHRSGTSKEARARGIAERDGVTEGLVCVLSVLEPCRSFAVAPNRQTRRLEVVRRPRKCLHYYLYLIDPEFGWMHVRLQPPTRSRSTSMAASGWRGNSMRLASGTGAATTRSPLSMRARRSRRYASGSPTLTGRRSWIAKRPWSIRCCPPSRTPAFSATGG